MFEWNEEKRLATIEKHGIDFVDAVEIFLAPHLLVEGRSEIEDRKLAVGDLNGQCSRCRLYHPRHRDPHHHSPEGATK